MARLSQVKGREGRGKTPPIAKATQAYEQWLSERMAVVTSDLDHKHLEMARSRFAFLRATFYRWVGVWQEVCSDLTDAPRLLAVGDLHVENYGTWRDQEGRLVWGVNDFDEVARMPYTIDLARLVTSAILARTESGLSIDAEGAASAVLDGYAESLKSGGTPFVLEDQHPVLRVMATSGEREPIRFWTKMLGLPHATPPRNVQRLLKRWLPDGAVGVGFAHRAAGLGSLGRPRYVAIAQCKGGLVAREAKAWLPPAWGWIRGRPKERAAAVRLLRRAVRQNDPFYGIDDGWVVRRLGPHCGRIGLAQFPKKRDEGRILKAMGREAANLHLATADQRSAILRDLSKRRPDWLLKAAKAMATATERDWREFRTYGGKKTEAR
jgi:hypothetical protein